MSSLDAPSPPASRKLSPSDFAFLWDQCRRCFYLKVAKGLDLPRSPMPQMFGKIADFQEKFFAGKRTEDLLPELPPGTFEHGERYVASESISVPGRPGSVFISGRVDTVICFDDGTYGVLDFKTAEPSPWTTQKYARQLHAYTYALEHARTGTEGLAPVTLLGLLCFDVAQFAQGKERKEIFYMRCQPAWLPVERNDEAFLAFVSQVMDVLESPELPAAGLECSTCRYRREARRLGGELGVEL